MAKKDYDVIAVGCGPGGATAGKFCALNGLKVLVIEQKREIGLPIQDGIAVIYSIQEQEEISGVKIETRWIDNLIAGHAYFTPSGKQGGTWIWPDGITIRRSLYEKGLAENAIRHGAEVWVDTRMVDLIKDDKGVVCGVKVIKGGEPKSITCSVVIGADGVYGNVARLAGIPLPKAKECFVGYGHTMIGVYPPQPPPPIYEIHFHPQIAPGFFAWIVPKGNGSLAVGLDYVPDVLQEDVTVRQLWQRFIKHLEDIGRYRFDKAGMVDMSSGASTISHQPAKKIVDDGVMLIGDGAWRPLFRSEWGAAGMYNAIRTGRWAAEVAAQAIKDGDVSERSLQRYPAKCAQSLIGIEGLIEEARDYYHKYTSLSLEMQEKALMEIGEHIAGCHLLHRAAAQAARCLPPIKEWFRKEGIK